MKHPAPIMFFLFTFFVSKLFVSCVQDTKVNRQDYNNDLVDLIIAHADGTVTQIFIPYDYDKHITEEQVKNTPVLLAEILKNKGYKVTKAKFSGFKPECADVMVKLSKGDCECTVYRVYEYTKLIDNHRIRENIDCRKTNK